MGGTDFIKNPGDGIISYHEITRHTVVDESGWKLGGTGAIGGEFEIGGSHDIDDSIIIEGEGDVW